MHHEIRLPHAIAQAPDCGAHVAQAYGAAQVRHKNAARFGDGE